MSDKKKHARYVCDYQEHTGTAHQKMKNRDRNFYIKCAIVVIALLVAFMLCFCTATRTSAKA